MCSIKMFQSFSYLFKHIVVHASIVLLNKFVYKETNMLYFEGESKHTSSWVYLDQQRCIDIQAECSP